MFEFFKTHIWFFLYKIFTLTLNFLINILKILVSIIFKKIILNIIDKYLMFHTF